MRFIWKYATVFGLVVIVYHLFFENILASILMTLLISFSMKETNYIVINETRSFGDNFTPTLVSGMYTIGYILFFLTLIKSIPFFGNLFWGLWVDDRERINRRIRYDELERERTTANPTESDTSTDYFSDDGRPWMKDPDIAFMNLTQAFKRSRCRRISRRLCCC